MKNGYFKFTQKLAELGVLNTKIGSTMAVNGVKSAPKRLLKVPSSIRKIRKRAGVIYTLVKLNPKHVLVAGGGILLLNKLSLAMNIKWNLLNELR